MQVIDYDHSIGRVINELLISRDVPGGPAVHPTGEVYSLAFFGRKAYYFIEVRSVQFEIDMSQVLLKLKSKKLHRIYLKLHSGKTLLITEEFDEKKAQIFCNQLKEIFEVDVENLQLLP